MDQFPDAPLIATERLRKRVRAASNEWQHRRMPRMRLDPHRLVFTDGNEDQKRPQWGVIPTHAVTTKMTRRRGRPLCGIRLEADAPFGHWRTQTFIAGLRIDELSAPWLLDGPMNRAAFDLYIETQLAPTLQPGYVVIADNLSSHNSARAQEVLKSQGSWLLFLPPYSPDLNPIEMRTRNSRHTCGGSRPAASTYSSNSSPKPAISFHQKNTETSSRSPDMLQIKWTML